MTITNEDFADFISYMEENAGENWINNTESAPHVYEWARLCGHVGEELILVFRAIEHYGG